MGVTACTGSQVKTWWSVENFNYKVNALNNCYEFNTGGHLRRDCPNRGQPRLTYSEEDLDEAVGVNAQDDCSIPAGIGKCIPMQTNGGVTGDVFIEISDKTMPGLVLPEIV